MDKMGNYLTKWPPDLALTLQWEMLQKMLRNVAWAEARHGNVALGTALCRAGLAVGLTGVAATR
jgi:hypothetical protein